MVDLKWSCYVSDDLRARIWLDIEDELFKFLLMQRAILRVNVHDKFDRGEMRETIIQFCGERGSRNVLKR